MVCGEADRDHRAERMAGNRRAFDLQGVKEQRRVVCELWRSVTADWRVRPSVAALVGDQEPILCQMRSNERPAPAAVGVAVE